mgnify:CR=1 FL=1
MGNNKFKILIVEDEANIRSFIKANLETSDYQVLCAETCALGMMMYASHHPDLIILDLGLPDRDGMSLIQEVRKTGTVPIIVLSARSSERDKVEALDLGANDYITKPFNVKILIARCSNLIKTRQQMLERLKQPIANKQEAPDTININDRQLLEKATQIIKENFENPEFDMNLLASELGMGRSKLYTKLKEITGLTPNEFTLKLKLEEAMHLLNNAPHLNVTEISYQLGFSSARYFSKCFKTFYGIAPLNVRKNANPSAKEE